MPTSLKLRRLLTAGIAVVGLAGATAAAAPVASATPPCSYYIGKYANKDVSTLNAFQVQHTGWCVSNAARAANGIAPLKNNSYLRNSSLGHANRSVALKFWSLTDGLASHVDPSQAGLTPGAAIAQRIANAGYCATGTPDTNENTFAAWGSGTYPPTIQGAVNWWLSDPPHRATLLSGAYVSLGFSAVPGLAFPVNTGGAQAASFVTDFGACHA
jgi:uncharacterized protein YkwD